MKRYYVQHGGTIILPGFNSLVKAFMSALKVKCARPIVIYEMVAPNESVSVVTITLPKPSAPKISAKSLLDHE